MSRGVDANGPQASSEAPWASFNGCLWAASNMGPAQSFWVLKPSYKHFNARSCTQFTFPLRYAGPDVSPGFSPSGYSRNIGYCMFATRGPRRASEIKHEVFITVSLTSKSKANCIRLVRFL